MKKQMNKRKVAAILAISSLALLTGCGKSADSTVGVVPGGVGPGGLYGPGGAYGAGGCIPITSTTQIPFTATGMYFGTTTDARVMAGTIPYKQSFGQVIVGGVDPSAGLGAGYGQYRGQRVDGTTISLNLTSGGGAVVAGYPGQIPGFGTTSAGFGAAGNASATGYIQVSPFIQQLLVQAAATTGYGGGGIGITSPGQIPGQYPGIGSQACVSNLAIDLQHTISSRWLYLGSIYFFLNGTQHGMALDF